MTAQIDPRFDSYRDAWRFAYSQIEATRSMTGTSTDGYASWKATQALAPVLLAASVDGWSPEDIEAVLMNPFSTDHIEKVRSALRLDRRYLDALNDFDHLLAGLKQTEWAFSTSAAAYKHLYEKVLA